MLESGRQTFEFGVHFVNSEFPQTVAQRREFGKSFRKQSPRSSHAEWSPKETRPDPIALLEEQKRVAWTGSSRCDVAG